MTFMHSNHLRQLKMPSSGFGEESEQEVKDTVKSTGDTYTWEELSKYNERYNAHVAVRGKVCPSLLQRISLPRLCINIAPHKLSLRTCHKW